MASIKTVLELVNAQFNAALKQSEEQVKRFKTSGEEAGKRFSEAAGAMNVASTALGASLIATGAATLSFADEITDLAAAHQEAISQVLGLGAALAANGGKAENAGRLMLEMSKSIDQANSGNLKVARSFEALGVSITDLGTASEREIRNKLIAGIAAIKDPAERAAKAFEVFGKAATGVDFTKLNQDIESNAAKYQQFEGALKTAGDAFDAIGKIAMDVKVAFAAAFEPLFRVISRLSPDINTLTVAFQALGVALTVIVAASVYRGVMALVGAFQALNIVMMANPAGFIAKALTMAATAALAYFSITMDGTDALKQNTDAAQDNADVKRDNEGLVVALAKEREGLLKVTEAFNKQNATIKEKLDLELKGLGLSEDQKRVATQLAEIEQNKEKALIDLKNQYNSLDAKGRAAQKGAYEEQVAIIKQGAEVEKAATEERIKSIQRTMDGYKNLQNQVKEFGAAEQEIFALQAKQKIDNAGLYERIDLEAKLAEITKSRAVLQQSLSKVSEEERGTAALVLNDAVNQVGLLNLGYEDIVKTIYKYIEAEAELGTISKESAQAVLESIAAPLEAIAIGAEQISKVNKEIASESRTFSSGWERAFRQYADNATNAASQAANIFGTFTKGMEDSIVNFVKTGKFEFKDLLNTIAEELLRSQIKGLIADVFGGGGKGGGGGSGSLITAGISAISSLFGFADGGSVPGSRPILVGERGPELFVPSSNGTVIPNNQMVAGGSVVTYNINAVDAASFRAMIARDPQFLYAVSEQGRKSIPGRR